MACVLLMGIPIPSWSSSLSALPTQSQPSTVSEYFQQDSGWQPISQQWMPDLQASEAVLLAQGMADGSMQRYAAILTKNNVVPNLPSTSANGVAGAVLVGDRLVVRGDFNGLSSALRDYATDPLNPPNPNITSAVHIHQGMATENGPFQYALTVTPNETGIGGRLAGEYTLTGEQLQALADGRLYVDIHTRQNRAGELRGIFLPL